MRVLVHLGAGGHYVRRCYRHAPASCGMLHRPEWEKMLEKVEGQWLEVETEHLFSDQFNTAPIPGVSEQGMRLMIEDVAAIEDDVREGVIKCNWCYGYDMDHDGACDKCGKSDYLEPLNPIRPVAPNETTEALGSAPPEPGPYVVTWTTDHAPNGKSLHCSDTAPTWDAALGLLTDLRAQGVANARIKPAGGKKEEERK